MFARARFGVASLALALGLAWAPLCAQSKGATTADKALARAFPKCEVERTTAFLTKADRKRVGELSGKPFESSIVYPYVATKDGKLVGTAYFDNHRVRTLREILMVVVTPAGTIARVDVCAFGEPRDYLPRDKWYDQFEGRALDEDLRLKRGIDGITGATLTARATADCARRVLALHRFLGEKAAAAARPVADPKAAPPRAKPPNGDRGAPTARPPTPGGTGGR
jgi:hypothetical protein